MTAQNIHSQYCVFGSDRHTMLDATQTPYQINDDVTHDAVRPGMDKPNGVCAFHADYLQGVDRGWVITPIEVVSADQGRLASALPALRALVDEASVAFQMSLHAHNDGAVTVADALTERGYELIADARALVSATPIQVSYHHPGRVGVISSLDPYAPTEWLRIWDEGNSTHATVQWHQVAEVAA